MSAATDGRRAQTRPRDDQAHNQPGPVLTHRPRKIWVPRASPAPGSEAAGRTAYHAGRRASVSADGKVLAGGLEGRALRFVKEWAGLRNEEILANWERARKNEPLLDIEPLP